MPAYAIYVSIAAMQAVSISLSVCRVRHPIRFSGRKIAFFPHFAAHLCRMCKISLAESCFPPNHNRFTIKQLQTAQTAYFPLVYNSIFHQILTNSATNSIGSEAP